MCNVFCDAACFAQIVGASIAFSFVALSMLTIRAMYEASVEAANAKKRLSQELSSLAERRSACVLAPETKQVKFAMRNMGTFWRLKSKGSFDKEDRLRRWSTSTRGPPNAATV
jgi:hypothetical protein